MVSVPPIIPGSAELLSIAVFSFRVIIEHTKGSGLNQILRDQLWDVCVFFLPEPEAAVYFTSFFSF